MKAEIHPEYVDAVITCSCGSLIQTRATKPAMHIDVCSECHPFFTGEQRIVDTAGRVERFQRRFSLGDPLAPVAPAEPDADDADAPAADAADAADGDAADDA